MFFFFHFRAKKQKMCQWASFFSNTQTKYIYRSPKLKSFFNLKNHHHWRDQKNEKEFFLGLIKLIDYVHFLTIKFVAQN